MGQYHLTVNLDKKEFIDPHKLGAGFKLWEQLANEGVGRALVILLAHPAQRGGGDLDVDENWHGPERKDMSKVGEMPEAYPAVAKRTIGRWRGDRIAIVGDYAEDYDMELPGEYPPISMIYGLCCVENEEDCANEEFLAVYKKFGGFKDVTDDVCKVIEHELNGRFVGDGWRKFVSEGDAVFRWDNSSGKNERVEGKITKVEAKKLEVTWPTGVKRYHGEDPKIDFL